MEDRYKNKINHKRVGDFPTNKTACGTLPKTLGYDLAHYNVGSWKDVTCEKCLKKKK